MEAADIHKACRLGDVKGLLHALYRSPESANALDPKLGWTPLYRSVICNQSEVARTLLEQGADPDQTNRLGDAPLHQAADSGLYELSRLLLLHRADPNVVQKGDVQVDGETPLHRAAEKGRAAVAELLLQSGAAVNTRSKSVRPMQCGKTPLHLAVEFNQVDTALVLLRHGANRDVPDCDGRSAMDLSLSPEMLAVFEQVPRASESDSDDFLIAESPTVRAAEVLSIRTSGQSPPVDQGRPDPARMLFPDPDSCSSTGLADLTRTYSFGAEVRRSQLAMWLEPYKLESLAQVLSEAGLDTIESLVAQLQSQIPLTPPQLQAIGVKKPGHCVRLLAAIEAAARGQCFLDRHSKPQGPGGMFECCQKPVPMPSFAEVLSMEDWLTDMDLGFLYPAFQATGYDHLESVLALNRTKYAITEELLEHTLGIQSPSDRALILARIREDAPRSDLCPGRDDSDSVLDQSDKSVACRTCAII